RCNVDQVASTVISNAVRCFSGIYRAYDIETAIQYDEVVTELQRGDVGRSVWCSFNAAWTDADIFGIDGFQQIAGFDVMNGDGVVFFVGDNQLATVMRKFDAFS